MQQLIVFDFDGVMVDSADECSQVALRAFGTMGGAIKDSAEAKRVLRLARPLMKNNSDFLAVLKAIEAGRLPYFPELSFEQFEQMKQTAVDHKEGEEFSALFYKVRKQMVESDFAGWVRLNPFYPGMAEVFRFAQQNHRVVISTTKDKQSVRMLLSANNIQLPDNCIISREFSEDKRDHVKCILRQFQVTAGDILFIEDIYDWLRYVQALGVKGVLVGWGYSREQDRKQAERAGVRIARTPEELKKMIAGFGADKKATSVT